ncbi:MAG: penicillin-binding transpeptidase domain-containing protein, partial [Planctomycetota bacterium]
ALSTTSAETGAVLALANHPTFDPKDFSRVLTREQKQYLAYKKKIDAKVFPRPRLPIYATWDRARNGIVAPGSTMKPFTAIASLQLGAIAPDEQVHCDKYFYIDGQRMKALRCNGVHNDADLRHALVHSCNIYFQTAMHRIFQANAETSFRGVMHGFGFGRSTGVEGESSRMGRRSFRLDRPDGKEEPYGSRLQVGIGQGRATAAPMQVARAYAGIATGYLPRVHLVARRGSMETPVERVRLPVTPIHLELVRQALHATNDPDKPLGRAGLARFEVACKTGTAQTGVANEYNAWLAGFAPAHANRPPIAFAMLVERSHKHGGDECARRLAEFLGRFYGTGDKQ